MKTLHIKIKDLLRDKKILIILIIIVGIAIGFCLQQRPKMPEEISLEAQLKSLGSIILENTKFEDFSIDRFSLKYPDWTKIEIDPLLIWPEEIVEKERILLYLTNPSGVKILVTKRELNPEDLIKPFPLVLRRIFEEERRVMEEKGGLTSYQTIREDFFENGVILESKSILFGQTLTSISKSVILRKGDEGFIYSVGISALEKIFEDYRPLANYVIDSVRYY